MAFVAVVPTIGSAVLPALGTAIGGLGSLASSIPVIGGSLGSLLGTAGAGTGLSGALGALGTGAGLGSAATALGTGLKGMIPAFGGMGTGFSGLSQGMGGLYAGADKMLAGALPNMGVTGTVTPAQGFLGGLMPQNSTNPFVTHGVKNLDPTNPFDLAQAHGLTQPTGGGLEKIASIAKAAGGFKNALSAATNPAAKSKEAALEDRVKALEKNKGLPQQPRSYGGRQVKLGTSGSTFDPNSMSSDFKAIFDEFNKRKKQNSVSNSLGRAYN